MTPRHHSNWATTCHHRHDLRATTSTVPRRHRHPLLSLTATLTLTMRTVEDIEREFLGEQETWDQSFLQRLIDDKVEERFDLDYKSAEALSNDKKDKITAEVSAM